MRVRYGLLFGGNLRTLFDLHMGQILSLISCLGFTGILYSYPQWRHFNKSSTFLYTSVELLCFGLQGCSSCVKSLSVSTFLACSISSGVIFFRISSMSRMI